MQPIPVKEIVQIFGSEQLNTPENQKKAYLIKIDSHILKDNKKPDTEWEFYVSIDPKQMPKATQIICDYLNENQEGKPRISLELAAKKDLQHYPIGQEIRLSFYEDTDTPESRTALLTRIAKVLSDAGIQPDPRALKKAKIQNVSGHYIIYDSTKKNDNYYKQMEQTFADNYIIYRNTKPFKVIIDSQYGTLHADKPIVNSTHNEYKLIQNSHFQELVLQGKGHCPVAASDPFALSVSSKKVNSPNLSQTSSTLAVETAQQSPSIPLNKPAPTSISLSTENKAKEAITKLKKQINQMHEYGSDLVKKSNNIKDDVEKGNFVVNLTNDLEKQVIEFEKNPTPETYAIFAVKFKQTIDNKETQLQLKAHRNLLAPIIANILLCLTGIGAILLAGKAIYGIATEDLSWNATLFGARTKREQESFKVKDSLNELDQAIKGKP